MADELKAEIQAIPETLRVFLDSCLWDKGLRDLPEEVHDKMILDLAARLNVWLITEVANHLTEAQANELNAFTDQDQSPISIMTRLQKVVPNSEEIFTNSMASFKQAYIGA